MRRTIILVPCKNEAGNIKNLVEEFLEHRQIDQYLYLIEGGSSDNTRSVCKEFSQSNKNYVFYLEQRGKGKFSAIKTALDVLNNENPDSIIAIWDADHSIKYGDVNMAIAEVKNSRNFIFTERTGANIKKGAMPFVNKIANRVIAALASFVFKFDIRDALSGTKVFPIGMFMERRNIKVDEFIKNDTYGDLSYFLLASLSNYEFQKISVLYYPRVYGQSGLKRFSNGIELLLSLKKAKKILKESQIYV